MEAFVQGRECAKEMVHAVWAKVLSTLVVIPRAVVTKTIIKFLKELICIYINAYVQADLLDKEVYVAVCTKLYIINLIRYQNNNYNYLETVIFL